ncbi:MAG TPA: glycosyltransferase family 2 protein [Solirubrobacteraceae bacterium]|nr:glycosyltransferase family 2 protein [Solirubrobacteraceae bacterium]
MSPFDQTTDASGSTIGLVGRRPIVEREPGAVDTAAGLVEPAAAASGASGRGTALEEKRSKRLLSIVIPTYNEQDNVLSVYERLARALDGLDLEWELIFSVDPCTDATEQLIGQLCDADRRVKMLRFSRRFGQPMATVAGLEAASGDAVVVVDCDLQDPPELIPELIERWLDGYDVVYAQRRTRAGETLPKRVVSAVGYRVIKRIADVDIPPNTGDFRLMSRRVVDNVVSLKEGHGFLRGLVGLVGFRQVSVLYDRDPRAGGRTKYNRFVGSLVIGLNGIVGFSRYPLQLISLIGMGLSGLAFALALAYLGLKLGGVQFPVGNPTIVIAMSFFSGIQLLSLGVIGEYVGRIYDESRNRPKYIVESRRGWDTAA